MILVRTDHPYLRVEHHIVHAKTAIKGMQIERMESTIYIPK
jgi:hypothetical protein